MLEILEKVEGNQTTIDENELEEIGKMRETLRRKKKEYQEMCQRNFDVKKKNFIHLFEFKFFFSKLLNL